MTRTAKEKELVESPDASRRLMVHAMAGDLLPIYVQHMLSRLPLHRRYPNEMDYAEAVRGAYAQAEKWIEVRNEVE